MYDDEHPLTTYELERSYLQVQSIPHYITDNPKCQRALHDAISALEELHQVVGILQAENVIQDSEKVIESARERIALLKSQRKS